MNRTKLILIIWTIMACFATLRVAYGLTVDDPAMSSECLEVVQEIVDACESVIDGVSAAKAQCEIDYQELAKQCKESTGASVDSPGWFLIIGLAILTGLIGGLL